MYGVFETPFSDGDPGLVWLPIVADKVWDGGHAVEVLLGYAQYVGDPARAAGFQATMNGMGSPIAFVFIGEVWSPQRPAAEPYRYGDIAASPERTQQRIVASVDRWGKRRMLIRARGDDRPREPEDDITVEGRVFDGLGQVMNAATAG